MMGNAKKRSALIAITTGALITWSAGSWGEGLQAPGKPAPVAPPIPLAPVGTPGTAGPPQSPWMDPALNPGTTPASAAAIPPPVSYGNPTAQQQGDPPPIDQQASPAAKALATAIQKAGRPPAQGGPDIPSGVGVPSGENPIDGPTASGIAPPMDPDELRAALAQRNGPPLPDAQLSTHRNEAGQEADLRRQSAILDLRLDVGKKTLEELKQEDALRVALARSKLPLAIGTPAIEAGTTSTAQQAAPPPTNSEGIAGVSVAGKRASNAVPVVFAIGGIGKRRTADVLVPYAGAREVSVGSTLPNDLTVVEIDPFTVIVVDPDGQRMSLPMGRSVPATPPIPQAPKPGTVAELNGGQGGAQEAGPPSGGQNAGWQK